MSFWISGALQMRHSSVIGSLSQPETNDILFFLLLSQILLYHTGNKKSFIFTKALRVLRELLKKPSFRDITSS